jgi:hypothetical protein
VGAMAQRPAPSFKAIVRAICEMPFSSFRTKVPGRRSPADAIPCTAPLSFNLLGSGHRKGPVTGPFLSAFAPVVRRQAVGLVNRRLRHGDLDVCADRDPEAIRLGHD